MQLPTIPKPHSLGNTAQEVLENALKLDTAGYTLYFQTVFDGTYFIDAFSNKWVKQTWKGSVPLFNPTPQNFDSTMLGMIANGEVTIRVSSSGLNPHYNKKFHNANGRKIPLE